MDLGSLKLTKTVSTRELRPIDESDVGKRLLVDITDKVKERGMHLRFMYSKNKCEYQGFLIPALPINRTISFDPNYSPEEFEPTTKLIVGFKNTYVYLFHELVHFYHDLCREYTVPVTLVEELRTTGLYMYKAETYSENALRQEKRFPEGLVTLGRRGRLIRLIIEQRA